MKLAPQLAWIRMQISAPATSDCVLWPFSVRSNGYGAAYYQGKCTTAHRAMCTEAHGPAPTPMHDAAHSCGNRACVNKRHLRWATRTENQADRFLHGTDDRGEKQYRSRLTTGQVTDIIRTQPRGSEVRRLAAELGVSRGAIYSIMRGKNWKHVGRAEP